MTITVWVNTDNVGSQDGTTKATGYTTQDAAIAAIAAAAPITDAYDIVCTGVTDDASGPYPNQITGVSATNKITVKPDTGDKSLGVWDSNKYTLALTSLIYIRTDYIIYEDIQIDAQGLTTEFAYLRAASSAGAPIFRNCYIKWDRDSTAGIVSNNDTGSYWEKCIFEHTGAGAGYLINETSVEVFRNCAAWTTSAANRIYRGVTCINCIGSLHAGSTYGAFYTVAAASDYNLSSDATADDVEATPGSCIINEADSVTFTDAVNGDFTLKTGSSAIDGGTDMSAYYTTDIAGTTFSTWDIGPFAYIGVGGAIANPMLYISKLINSGLANLLFKNDKDLLTATALQIQQVTDLRLAYLMHSDVYDCLNNVIVTQRDRFNLLRNMV